MNGNKQCSALFLDSGGGWTEGSTPSGSFLLFSEPEAVISYQNGEIHIRENGKDIFPSGDPVAVLEQYVSRGYVAAGYIGYEYAENTDTGFKPARRKEGYRYPQLSFYLFGEDKVVTGGLGSIGDYVTQAVVRPELPMSGGRSAICDFHSNLNSEDYRKNVLRVKEYINSGDVYQVNLSRRITLDMAYDPLSYFIELFHVQHVPFACYLDFDSFQLVSGSMELFMRKRGRRIITRPIKGTTACHTGQEQNAVSRARLLASEKERAENLMIVDLMRNDLGRICEHGTVSVNKLFDIESYSTLHQMVSEVEGELKGDVTLSDIISNIFPPGSVTGAPKKRALEIIDELEPHYRGPYCGITGIIYPDGDCVFNVGIRTLAKRRRTTEFWVGGGVVWDSEPEAEFEETRLKALAMERAFGLNNE